MEKDKGKVEFINRKELQQMPEYSNQVSKATEDRLGAFVWDIDEEFEGLELVSRLPCELDNGAIYHGQWNKDGLREGKGT